MNSFYLATLQPYVFCVVIYFTSGPQTIEETAEINSIHVTCYRLEKI